jgi:hypothetical protein
VTRTTIGRTHWIEANLKQIAIINKWLNELESLWETRLDKLNEILTNEEAEK